MEVDTCLICGRETADPLLWPPGAKSRIVVCEGCFIELFALSEELSSKPQTIPPDTLAPGTQSEAEAGSADAPLPEPAVKNRRLTARWAMQRSAQMSWLVGGGPVSVKVNLVDGSEHGLGVRSPKAVEAGRAVRIKLTDATALRGDVRHCHPAEGGFRLGVLLKNVRLLSSE